MERTKAVRRRITRNKIKKRKQIQKYHLHAKRGYKETDPKPYTSAEEHIKQELDSST